MCWLFGARQDFQTDSTDQGNLYTCCAAQVWFDVSVGTALTPTAVGAAAVCFASVGVTNRRARFKIVGIWYVSRGQQCEMKEGNAVLGASCSLPPGIIPFVFVMLSVSGLLRRFICDLL